MTTFQTLTCPTHGDYQGQVTKIGERVIRTTCPQCREEENDDEHKRIACERLLKFKAEVRASGIPSAFWGRGFKSYKPVSENAENALRTMKEFVATFGTRSTVFEPDMLMEGVKTQQGMLFVGDPGTGKTHLACATAQELLHAGKASIRYITAYDASLMVKSTWSKGSTGTESGVYKELCEPDLLIIDEIGVQHGSATDALIFFNVFNKRLGEGLPTLLISNLDATQLESELGTRVFDRIRDGQVFGFVGESQRGKNIMVL